MMVHSPSGRIRQGWAKQKLIAWNCIQVSCEVAGAQQLGLSSVIFPGTLTESWIGIRMTRTQTYACMGCLSQAAAQHAALQHQSSPPHFIFWFISLIVWNLEVDIIPLACFHFDYLCFQSHIHKIITKININIPPWLLGTLVYV